MDGWMDGWKDGWMDRWLAKWSFAEDNLKTREQTVWINITDLYRSRKRFHTSSFRIREIRACIIAVAFRTSGWVSDRDEFVTNLQKGTPEKRVSSFTPTLHLFTAKRRNKTGTFTRFINFSLTLSNSILFV